MALDVKISIGKQADQNKPLVLYDNSFSNQITNLINVDIGLVDRFNVISSEDNKSQLEHFSLHDNQSLLMSIFAKNIQPEMWKETSSKKILLRSFVLKSLF